MIDASHQTPGSPRRAAERLACASRLTQTESRHPSMWRFNLALSLFLLMAFLTPALHAAPSQNDVFKSIQESMDKPQDFDYRPVLLLVGGGGVAVLLLLVVNRRQKGTRPSQTLNSPAKLMKEVLREISLNSGEVKQLKLMAAAVENPTPHETNPLVLLLCPSVMAKGLHRAGGKVDRKAVATIVRKLRQTGK